MASGWGAHSFAVEWRAPLDVVKESQGVQSELGSTDKATEEKTEFGSSGSYLSSQFSRSSGDIDTALKSLREVYKTNPQDIDIANQLMGLYLLGGKVDKAMEIASNIAKANKKEPIAALMLALRAIKSNDSATASAILDAVFEDEGGQLWLPLISAWLDIDQHKLLKPLMIEELSTEVGRAAPIVNYHLALINSQAGFVQAAAQNFKESVDDSPQPAARVMQMLLQFYDNNKSPEILKPIVEAYRKANPDADKIKPVMVSNMRDGTAEVLLTMGSVMLAADVTQDATLYLQLALYIKPDLEVANLILAQAYGELQQYGIANEILAKIQPSSQLYNSAQLYYAVNLGRMKKADEAILRLDQVIEATPNNIDAYMAKGDLLRMQERYPEAVKVYEATLASVKELKPQHWPIFFAMGTCLDKLGDWAGAEKNLKTALELSPEQPDVLNYLGYSYLMRGENIAQAKELIGQAIKKRPSDPQIIDSMGWALYLAGEYQKSVEYLERAVSLLPADVAVNEHLGDAYWRLGRKIEARFQWDRVVTYSKDEKLSQEIRKKIAEGLPEVKSGAGSEQKNSEQKNIEVPMNATKAEVAG